ncbi:MAG: hypothetical protein R3286_16840 [Gammaproteobacteria bacterium]|nr:hypothetical protein [Gammaproteobacteria bacterium]
MYTLPEAPGSIGETLDAGFKLLAACFKHVIGWTLLMAAILYLPIGLAGAWLVNGGEPDPGVFVLLIPGIFIGIVVYLVVYLGVVHRVGVIATGRLEPMRASMGVALRRTWRVVLAGLVYMLVVTIGMVLFIVPGVLFMLSMGFYMFCILLDGDGVFESLGRSHRLVWGKWWRTALIASVVMVIYMIAVSAISIPMYMINAFVVESPALQSVISHLGEMIATAVTAPVWVSVFVVVFHDLKLRTEGQDLEARVEALAPSH